MSDSSRIENEQAAHEARDAVVSPRRGSSASAIAAAMRRYLSTEQYRQLSKDGKRRGGRSDETDEVG